MTHTDLFKNTKTAPQGEDAFIISSRFNGPPESANGGYACGLAAAFIDGPARVKLVAPPPLDAPLRVKRVEDSVELLSGEQVIAVAGPAGRPGHRTPAQVAFAEAGEAATRFAHFDNHVFPTCFVCGPRRAPGDGLRLFPGGLEGCDAVAAPWTPDASLASSKGTVDERFVWAALDCPTFFAFQRPDLRAVLGSLTVAIDRAPKAGAPCVVVAWPLTSDGRKHKSAAVLLGHGVETLALAEALWIELQADAAAAFGAQ